MIFRLLLKEKVRLAQTRSEAMIFLLALKQFEVNLSLPQDVAVYAETISCNQLHVFLLLVASNAPHCILLGCCCLLI